jgi:hypothetical protein
MEQDEAVQLMRDAREGMLRNPAQLLYLRAFKKTILEMPNVFPSANLPSLL